MAHPDEGVPGQREGGQALGQQQGLVEPSALEASGVQGNRHDQIGLFRHYQGQGL